MNSLSWFLYLTSVAERVNMGLLVLAVVLALASIIVLVVGAIIRSDNQHRSKSPERDEMLARASYTQSWAKLTAPLAVSFFVVAWFVPSKTTLYMIAASEIGERVATSEPVTEMAREANDILRSYLKKAREELIPAEKK